jgi:ABC-type methionine transport system permease subunit
VTALAFTVLAVLAALLDVTTFAWHRAREREQRARTVTLGVAHELLGAVPFMIAIELSAWWPIAASVVGSIVGSTWAMRRAPAA